jgi:hypothetical protein
MLGIFIRIIVVVAIYQNSQNRIELQTKKREQRRKWLRKSLIILLMTRIDE